MRLFFAAFCLPFPGFPLRLFPFAPLLLYRFLAFPNAFSSAPVVLDWFPGVKTFDPTFPHRPQIPFS